MGKYYALAQGEDASVAAASEEHYKPQGPADRVPNDPVSVAVALADKIDTLVGFWAIDEKPTGSKDPYALRRAALGVIRLIVENTTKTSDPAARRQSRNCSGCLMKGPGIRHADDAKASGRSACLLRRPPESPAPRSGRAARSRRCRVRARRPGRSPDGGPPRRGAREIPRQRRRQEPARRHQARQQHPRDRGEEGQAQLRRRAGCVRSTSSTRKRRWRRRSIRSRPRRAPPSPRKISPPP